ncbi:uncharacterized protein LOC133382221 isoform X2 [Rhineura floridana]|uniref:uncharacterized protein LOC133382221 isoform X2 n=1 Tax=Rhineura floridana TaxID=261503 RepID=UPI002AC889AB|nr:uncharacterized protein LOC133382221 isoform X2 [Rhineura floridana]
MKPSSGSRRGRFRIVYVNRFGSHRSGTVIHYGSGGSLLRHHEKVARADTHFCLVDKSPPTIPDRKGSEGAASLSPREGTSPSFIPEAPPKRGTKEIGGCGNQPRNQGVETKGSKTRKVAKAKKAPKVRKAVTESPLSLKWSSKMVAVNPTVASSQKQIGGCQETQRGTFEFPSSLEDANNVIGQRKKKSAVWLGVCKVISKMVEENGHFRSRLMSCSQLSSEGKDVNWNVQTEISSADIDEAIFGWV